jgi:uncharacterized protein YkwD
MTFSAAPRTLALVALLVLVGIAPASALGSSSYEKQVVTATNSYRADQDVAAVKHQACVDRWAESQARWMAKRGVLQHRAGRLGQIMKACKLTGASENIAWNYSSGTEVVRAWKDSSGHARNMRSAKMRYIGVGAVKDDDGQWWVSQVFGTRK